MKKYLLALTIALVSFSGIFGQISILLVDDSDDGFTILVKEDQLRICRNLLGRMGEKCRKILLWAEGEGRPMKWIAQSLGYSGPQVAMNKKSSCKKKLMDLVRKHPEYTTLIHEIIRN